jgi:DNA polymerase-3 subunit gamma/tau
LSSLNVIMSDFIVSARKYRPSTFDTVVGQGPTTSTLKNAIRTEHLAQAYLFCGPRGVGKTTCARIFAKTINCTNPSSNNEACNECDSCMSFAQNRSFNIHELDAASNNSVDDIRNLIDQVRIPPQVGRYSVYIIDEVHMLSQSAFNAFLKTLEEPPRHAIFILATTEKHKILPTILSRCQIFDFNRIKIKDIVEYLEYIAKIENIKYETDALAIIAQKADGGMRDALSVFDQIASFSGNEVTYKNVIENLNVLDYEYYFRLTDYFLNEEVASSMILFDEILAHGFDAQNFINGLSQHFRDLLMCKAEKTLQLLEVGENIKVKYKEQSLKCSDTFLFSCLEICNAADLAYKQSKNPRLHIELTLVRLCNLSSEKKKDDKQDDILILPDTTWPIIVQKSDYEPDKSIIQTVKEPPEQTPARNIRDTHHINTTPSIKDALSQINKQYKYANEITDNIELYSQSDDFNKEIQNKPFTSEELNLKWKEFVETIKNIDQRIFLALRNQIPELNENNVISISFRNNALIDVFKDNIRHLLLSFLKSGLENENIEIEEKIIEENQQTPLKHYSDLEKLKYMMDKNPALQKLRQEFNLDLD